MVKNFKLNLLTFLLLTTLLLLFLTFLIRIRVDNLLSPQRLKRGFWQIREPLALSFVPHSCSGSWVVGSKKLVKYGRCEFKIGKTLLVATQVVVSDSYVVVYRCCVDCVQSDVPFTYFLGH